MKELFVMVAKMMPEEMLIAQIEQALTAYRLAPSAETKSKLASTCTLLALQVGMEGKDVVDCLKEVKHHDQIAGTFKAEAY